MRVKKLSLLAGAAVLVGGAVLVVAAPALAAAPTNDTFGGAIPIGSVPFSAQVDTSEATTDADDSDANAFCGAPATDASVWYSITPTAGDGLVVDVSSSSYTAGVLVVTGSPGAFTLVTCGPGAVAFPTSAGVTYHLLLIDDQFDGSGNGGTLMLNVDQAPPPPTIDASVSPTAGFNAKTGSATVHGTVVCTGTVNFAFVDVELHQKVGRGEVVGFGAIDVTCDGTAQPWSVEIFPIFGQKFAGGKGASITFAVACGPFQCAFDFEQRTVQLSRRG